MKIKFFATIVCIMLGTGVFAQAQRDTIFIYDTVRISVKRPTPPPTDFFEQPTATISEDSIITVDEPQKQSTMSNLRNSANQLIRRVAMGTMAVTSGISAVIAQPDTMSALSEKEIMTDTVVTKIIEVDTVSTPQKEAPIYLSFAYPLGLYGVNSENYVFNLAFSVLTGAVGGINGIQFGGIYNQVSGPMRGIQWAGIMNVTKSVDGIQWAGICNFSQNVRGIQWAGIFNQSANLHGIQWAAIANAANNVEGMQWAGIYNAADTVTGMQWAAIANEAEVVTGMQWGGIYNRAERVRGLQMGLYNQTKVLNGVQIGLINKVDTIEKGVSFGLFNFLKKDRFQELEFGVNIGADNYSVTYLNYRLGGHVFHGLLGIGTTWKDGHFESRVGFGNNTRFVDNLYLQTSWYWTSSNYYFRTNQRWTNNHDSWATLSCGLAYYWGNKIGIKVIPKVNNWLDFSSRSSRFIWSYDFGVDFGLSIKL
jgi:hypothetical protein